MSLLDYLQKFPIGYSEVYLTMKKYGVSRTDFNNGRSIKLYAEELDGSDFISLNFYLTSTSENLRPCEIPKRKVINFLLNCSFNK